MRPNEDGLWVRVAGAQEGQVQGVLLQVEEEEEEQGEGEEAEVAAVAMVLSSP